MLLRALRVINPKLSLKVLAKTSGISLVHLYAINKRPERKNLQLQTLDAIYNATKELTGYGLTPNKYLIGVNMPFAKQEGEK